MFDRHVDDVPLEILDVNEEVIAECDLMISETARPLPFPINLVLQIQDETGLILSYFVSLHSSP